MLTRNALKKIKKSLGRFISLIAIILIGVGFYAGIRQSIPAIRDVQNRFTENTNLMDIHIVSTLGLTDKDVAELEKLDQIDKVTAGYSEYVYDGDDVIRVLSIDNTINRTKLQDGIRPVEDNECIADAAFYKVGDVITVREASGDEADEEELDDTLDEDADQASDDAEESDETATDGDAEEDSNGKLRVHKFYVVGTVVSPLYIGEDYGNVNMGNGILKSYIFVNDDCFNMKAYTDVYLTVKKNGQDVPYSKSYDDKVEKLKKQVEGIKEDRQEARSKEVYEKARQAAYDAVEKEREKIRKEVRAELEKKIRDEVEAEREKQKGKLKEKAAKLGIPLDSFIDTLSDGLQSLFSPVTDWEIDAMVDDEMDEAMADAMKDIKDAAVDEIEVPECKWYIYTRNDEMPTYKTLRNQYEEVEVLADIIPLFFIIIVILMTSNTMSRMIAEERGEMGTLTSLGYSNFRIIGSYMIYVLLATFIGGLGGYFLGLWLLPGFVYDCFPLHLPDIRYMVDWKMIVAELLVAFVIMTGVTIYSCMMELKHKPAYLLRPVPPKKGKKLAIEKVKSVWGRLSFSWKITIRNLFRYKRRVIMTVIGIGGCTFLMLIGFALRDSISVIGDKQFSDISHYDVMAVMDTAVTDFSKIESGDVELDKLLVDPLMMRQESLQIESKDTRVDVYLLVPDQDSDLFTEYFTLRAADPKDIGDQYKNEYKKGEELELEDEGVIITPRIAYRLKVKIGDKIVLKDEDGEKYSVVVSAITENYVSNYVYMSEDLYRGTFRRGVMYNTVVSRAGISDSKELSKKLYDIDTFVNVSISDDVKKKANDAIKGMDGVVILLVIISSLLAFTVIYNLISISISERTREIATLKVLGFTPVETNNYIYRETIISSIIGIIIGLAITPYLHGMVLSLVGVDNLVFVRHINAISFLIAAGFSILFTMIMMLVTFAKLRNINMIESLKSVD